MTTFEKYKKLVELLYQRTSDRKIEWVASEGEDVWARIGDRFIKLSVTQNNNLEPVERVSIHNAGWEAVESFDDEVFENADPGVEGFTSYWRLMSRTRNMAYRQAIGADDAIDQVLNALGDDDVPS